MPYDYATMKPQLFTEEGNRRFIRMRDNVKSWCKSSGACRIEEMMAQSPISGADSWEYLAYFDRMAEMGDLLEMLPVETVKYTRSAAQHRVFIWIGG